MSTDWASFHFPQKGTYRSVYMCGCVEVAMSRRSSHPFAHRAFAQMKPSGARHNACARSLPISTSNRSWTKAILARYFCIPTSNPCGSTEQASVCACVCVCVRVYACVCVLRISLRLSVCRSLSLSLALSRSLSLVFEAMTHMPHGQNCAFRVAVCACFR